LYFFAGVAMLKTDRFTYRYIPARTPPPTGEKVLVVFHGLGDSLNGFTWMPSQMGLGELSYFLVNAPDDYYGGYAWFDFEGDRVPGVLRSRGLILELLQDLIAQGIRSEDILLFGFSQGCLMALDAGLRAPMRLGGIVGVSGWLAFKEEYPNSFSAYAKKQKFLVTHGLRDPLLPYAMSKMQCDFVKSLGIDLEFRSYDKEHTILPEELDGIRKWLQERIASA
jgi:phospholipase/carboxylesterase